MNYSFFDSKVVKGTGFSVCDVFTGHGIGREFHCPPQIIHTGIPFLYKILSYNNCKMIISNYCIYKYSIHLKYHKCLDRRSFFQPQDSIGNIFNRQVALIG